MPPRITGVQRLPTLQLCLRPAVTPAVTPSLIQTASLSTREQRKLKRQDPYRWAQAKQRTRARKEIHDKIEAAREATMGHPVHGITTPFVESFDSAGQAAFSSPPIDVYGKPMGEPRPLPTSPHFANHLLYKSELETAIQRAYELSKPIDSVTGGAIDPVRAEEDLKAHEEAHERASEAVRRITSLQFGSSKDRKHVNIRRCIEKFGRHVTDETLTPKPLSRGQKEKAQPVRGGPDTGSSEVQIAILTAKIRALAGELSINRGHKDKANKRNLRMMVHRRQRLLRYMEKKERGSERWTHLLQTLGLTPATWKDQITL